MKESHMHPFPCYFCVFLISVKHLAMHVHNPHCDRFHHLGDLTDNNVFQHTVLGQKFDHFCFLNLKKTISPIQKLFGMQTTYVLKFIPQKKFFPRIII